MKKLVKSTSYLKTNNLCETYSKEQVQEILGISRCLTHELIKSKQIRSLKIGRRVLIPKKVLHDFIYGKMTK